MRMVLVSEVWKGVQNFGFSVGSPSIVHPILLTRFALNLRCL